MDVRTALRQGLNHIGWIYCPGDGNLYRRSPVGAWNVAPMFADGSPDLENEVDVWTTWRGSYLGYRQLTWWLEEQEEVRLNSSEN